MDSSASCRSTAAPPSMTMMSCDRASLVMILSPASKLASSNLSTMVFCCASVSCLKKLNSALLLTLSNSIALIALLRSTSSTGPMRRSSELFPNARHFTLSHAFALLTWREVFVRTAEPKIVPSRFTALFPSRSTVSTVPSMTMNIQSPTSPSRTISCWSLKDCTEQTPASIMRSLLSRNEKLGSEFRNPIACCRFLSLSLSMQCRKRVPSIFQRTPSSLQATDAVLLTLYSMANSPNVWDDFSCRTLLSSIVTVKTPLWTR
mmetsp:Transcript_56187/g.158353  ORF Transcript_56187/g.158353 Transcript_56187/m.158353 type:complete len:262 (-) Transcript_56187:423-1208(-)